jgi:hypothetical protein
MPVQTDERAEVIEQTNCSRRAGRASAERTDPAAAAKLSPRDAIAMFLSTVKDFVIERAGNVHTLPEAWLWPNRIPIGHLTLLAGDSGSGKSLLALDLAARVSRGAPWPDEPDVPGHAGNVIVLTAHDDSARVGRPRLERAGADLDRVFFATGMPRKNEMSTAQKRQIRLPDDLLSLSKFIFKHRPTPLVVLDPAWVFCNPGRGRSRLAGPAQLVELTELAAHLHVAIVCVTDLRREGWGQQTFRAGGDRALTAAAQAGWGIVRHPQDQNRRLLLPVKMNLAAPPAGLEFKIEDGRIEWDTVPAKLTAAAVFAAEREGTIFLAAEKWLLEYLAQGRQPGKEVLSQARECGFSARTVHRAKAVLGVRSEKCQIDGASCWFWSLAAD